MIRLTLADEAATLGLGAKLADGLFATGGGVVYLCGDLGVGKTTLARGLLRAAGAQGTLRSPTYTLMEPYTVADQRVLHLDLYRLVDPEEVEYLGLRDYPPESTLWLVEWPERGWGHLPPPTLVVRLLHDGAARVAELEWPSGQPIFDIK